MMIITITLLCLDKIRRNIPPQPVYSKEMSEKIEMEVEKLRSGNSIDYKVEILRIFIYQYLMLISR